MIAAPGWALITTAALLAGCAGPEIHRGLGSNTETARLALELDADVGPIRGDIVGYPFLEPRVAPDEFVLAAFADGVPAKSVVFSPAASRPTPNLIVRFNPVADTPPCEPGERRARSGPPEPESVVVVEAAFCQGGEVIAVVRSETQAASGQDGRLLSLYRRLSRTLFPDLYPERYGFETGFGINVGIGTGY